MHLTNKELESNLATQQGKKEPVMGGSTVSAPVVSCLHLSNDQWQERTKEAVRNGEQLSAERGGRFCGDEILWHPDNGELLIALISDVRLHEVGVWMSGLDRSGACLDFADYCYLADVLRDGIAEQPTPQAAVRLRRALAWVKLAAATLQPQQ